METKKEKLEPNCLMDVFAEQDTINKKEEKKNDDGTTAGT